MACSRQVLTGDCFNTTEECLHILFALSFILVEVCSGTSVTFATIAEFFMGMVTFDVGCKNKRNLMNSVLRIYTFFNIHVFQLYSF